MKKKFGDRFSKPTVSCLQETVLRQLVKIAGLEEMTTRATDTTRGT
jgi:hypothetical protein